MGDDNKAGLVSRFSRCMKCVAQRIYLLGGYGRQVEGGWVTWASMVATICPYSFSRTTTITARVMGDDNEVGLVSRFSRCMKCIARCIYLHLLVIIQRCATQCIYGGGAGIRFQLCWLLNADARKKHITSCIFNKLLLCYPIFGISYIFFLAIYSISVFKFNRFLRFFK